MMLKVVDTYINLKNVNLIYPNPNNGYDFVIDELTIISVALDKKQLELLGSSSFVKENFLKVEMLTGIPALINKNNIVTACIEKNTMTVTFKFNEEWYFKIKDEALVA
jgi:hypothetical protein